MFPAPASIVSEGEHNLEKFPDQAGLNGCIKRGKAHLFRALCRAHYDVAEESPTAG